MNIKATRVCEKCGTERHISGFRQAVDTLAGKRVVGEFGEAKCKCPDSTLNDLDREAIERANP